MANAYRFGRFTLDLSRGCLQTEGRDLDLRPKSFELLVYLVKNVGRLATKDELLETLWPGVSVSEDSLAQCIRDIRMALDDKDRNFIKTVQRRGYIFVAEVVPTNSNGDAAATSRRIPAAVGAALAIGILTALIGVWAHSRSASPPSNGLSIAVIPFSDTTDAPGSLLAEGFTEELTTALARFRDVSVISRSASFRYWGDKPDPSRIGQHIGARYLLQGSVRRSENLLRVTAQLFEASTGKIAWAGRYDRRADEVFDVQEEIAKEIAGHFVVHSRTAAAEEHRARPASSLEAYELVLRARRAFRTYSKDGAIEARSLAEKAVVLDPDSPTAWELLARILTRAYIVPWDASYLDEAALRDARLAALRSTQLDPANAMAHATLGYVFVWLREYDRGLEALRMAVTLNPNDAEVQRGYGDALGLAGDHEGSLSAFDRSQRLDPFTTPIALALIARAYNMLGRYDQAIKPARNCTEHAPTLPACFLNLAFAAQGLGDLRLAKEATDKLVRLNPNASVTSQLRLVQFKKPSDTLHYATALRKAGFPE